VIRDCVSGEILLARPLLSERESDLVALLKEVQDAFSVLIRGVISDDQKSLRNAVATALPGIPHQLCHFHYLREAAKPVYEADRHGKYELKKQVRGIRPIEREAEHEEHEEATITRKYCLAVRSAASYWPGLFHCYDIVDLPYTNNDLEHVFGSTRYHERRATGRKQASPGLVVRGSVRLVAAVATQNYHFSGSDLAPRDLAQWRTLRQQVDYRHEARREHARFRKDPERSPETRKPCVLDNALLGVYTLNCARRVTAICFGSTCQDGRSLTSASICSECTRRYPMIR
jgi:hypothetical protein